MARVDACDPVAVITQAFIPDTHKPMVSKTRKRRTVHGPPLVKLFFETRREGDFFLRCGQHMRNATPCVDRTKLDPKYQLIYEKWQRVQNNGNKEWFRCRRRGTCRRKHAVRRIAGKVRLRERNEEVEYIACKCDARYVLVTNGNGSVEITFRGTHNHDVQGAYAACFLNPIEECFTIREIVDNKLFAGVTNVQQILSSVLSETFNQREEHKTFEKMRACHMAVYISRSQIRNRISKLGLDLEKLLDRYVYFRIFS